MLTPYIFSLSNSILTLSRKQIRKDGAAEKTNNQRQPRVGITNDASVISNNVPHAHATCFNKCHVIDYDDQMGRKYVCKTLMPLAKMKSKIFKHHILTKQ